MDHLRNGGASSTAKSSNETPVSDEQIIITRNVVENKTPNGPRYTAKNSVNQQNFQAN